MARTLLKRFSKFGNSEELTSEIQGRTVASRLLKRISNFALSANGADGSKSHFRKQSIAIRSLGLRKLSDCGRSKIEYEESKRKIRKPSFAQNLRARLTNNYGPVKIAPEKEKEEESAPRHSEGQVVEDEDEDDGVTISPAASPLMTATVDEKEEEKEQHSGISFHSKSLKQRTFLPSPDSSFSDWDVTEAEVQEEPVVTMKCSHIRYRYRTSVQKQQEEEIFAIMQAQEYEEEQEDIRRLKREERRKQNSSNWEVLSFVYKYVCDNCNQEERADECLS